MVDFLKLGDGSGRIARPIQDEILTWVSDNWQSRRMVMQLPVAVGKSFVARAIQKVTSAHVITPANVLIDQYTETYDTVNFLKGKAHYVCNHGLMSCSDWQDAAGLKACDNCPYAASKAAACSQPTFFNPMSLYYATMQDGWQKPQVIVVDEAHQLASMMLLMAGTRLRKSEYKFDDKVLNERYMVIWIDSQIDRLRKMARYYAADKQRFAEINTEIRSLNLVRTGFYENAQNYATWIEDGRFRGKKETFLNIKPLRPPRYIAERLLDAHRVIMMSGTMFEPDIQDLLGSDPYAFLDVDSPIPKDRRPVHYDPAPYKMNHETDPATVAADLVDTIRRNTALDSKQPNTIIHVSYAWSKRLQKHVPDHWLVNTPENKAEILEKFKRDGGVFLAAGCAEGLDLKGDICRLNIIPHLLFPSMHDEVVKRRKALEDGEIWYLMETMKAVIQQAGRSTRDVKDWSKVIIRDRNFAWVYKRVKEKLPKSFKDSICWSNDGRVWPPVDIV